MKTPRFVWPGLIFLGLIVGAARSGLGAEPAAPSGAPPGVAAPTGAAAGPAEAAEPGKEELLSLTVSDANLADVLRSLAQMRPSTNILIGPEVKGTVSFALRDVTWDMALKLIVESQGYEVVSESENLFRIQKPATDVKQPITVELMTKADVEGLADEQIALLLGPTLTFRTPEEARQHVMRHPEQYLKRLAVENRPAAEVIAELAKATGQNFAFSVALQQAQVGKPGGEEQSAAPAPKLPGPPSAASHVVLPPVSLSLKFVSVEEAINLVAQQGGLSCIQKNGVWVITPRPAQEVQLEPLSIQTFELQFVRLDDQLVKIFKDLLSNRGQVSRAGTRILIVRDTAQGLDNVRKTLEIMDKPTPQVLIEARFFELKDAASKKLGIDWSTLGDGVGFNAKISPLSRSKTTTVKHGTTFEDEATTENTVDSTPAGIDFLNATGSKATTGTSEARDALISTTRAAVLDVTQFGVVLRALMTTDGAKQLSNPKVLVNSDQQATIHIGKQTPILKSTVESTPTGPIRTYELDGDFGGETVEEMELLTPEPTGAGGRGASSSDKGKMRKYTTPKGYLDLGTKLTVAPSVKTPDQIYVKVVPERISFLRSVSVGTGESKVEYPELFTTRVHTEFTIRSGQTIAIGGLANEETVKTVKKVPVLGSIPVAGRLFSHEVESKDQTETIVFLTVKVVDSSELTTTTAVPVRSFLIQPELDRIANEDSEGAVYSPERAQMALQEKADAEKRKSLKERTRRLFRNEKPAAPAAAPGRASPEAQEEAPVAK